METQKPLLKDLQGKEAVVEQEVVADKEPIVDTAQVSAAAITVTINDINLAKALEDLKTSKPKIRGIVIKDHEEPSESRTTTTNFFKEITGQGKQQEEINEEERLVGERARQQEEVNIALIETWEDIQEKMDADCQLAKKVQAEEQQKLNEEEKAKLFMELLEKRRKFFAAKRTKEKRNIPPTKAQQRSLRNEFVEESSKKAQAKITQEEGSKRAGDELE
uniref:Uncharacterized protein n=1 Tax=Tanacetum cinerariifolium TaxID=118510 RepID=A0A6L2LTY4_TANCI|nr:hypothetical protein [Tanacetum cinerariifolium]